MYIVCLHGAAAGLATSLNLQLFQCGFLLVLCELRVIGAVAYAFTLLRVNIDFTVMTFAICFAFVMLDPDTEPSRVLLLRRN